MLDGFNYSRIFRCECCALATFNGRPTTDIGKPNQPPMNADKIKTQANDTHRKPQNS
jgi:hypothetical protein